MERKDHFMRNMCVGKGRKRVMTRHVATSHLVIAYRGCCKELVAVNTSEHC